MAKRKQARTRQKKPVSLHWLKPALAVGSVAASAIGLALLLQWMQDPRAWPLNKVQVEGRFQHLQQSGLEAEITPLLEAGFFVVDVAEIQKRLGSLPWVNDVSVRRVWPDRITVSIVEQKAVARWGDNGFLNQQAEVFTPTSQVDIAGLSQLAGPQGYEQRVLDMYRQLQGLLQPLRLEVDDLQLDARRAWHMTLSNGLVLEIGRGQPVQRVSRFVRVYPSILAAGSGQLVAVDLRYSNGFAVRWQPLEDDTRSTG